VDGQDEVDRNETEEFEPVEETYINETHVDIIEPGEDTYVTEIIELEPEVETYTNYTVEYYTSGPIIEYTFGNGTVSGDLESEEVETENVEGDDDEESEGSENSEGPEDSEDPGESEGSQGLD